MMAERGGGERAAVNVAVNADSSRSENPVVGDSNGHVGLGVKCSKEVATAIRGEIILAKLSVIPVRRGYWGNKIGKPHTVPCKVTGKCGSVMVRLVPAPRGSGIC